MWGSPTSGSAHWNCSAPALYEHALRRGEGELAYGGGFVTTTGEYTGRSPKDKFIVDEPSSSGDIWWGPINQKISDAHFDIVHKRMLAYFQGREVFVQDVFAGADPEYRLKVRVVTEQAWHSLFTSNMFIKPAGRIADRFEPQFTLLHAPNMHSIPEIDGTASEVFVLLNFARRLVLVGGSHYTGEIKKTIFSVLNYLLPARNVLPMHCSANIGDDGDTAIFFGLSGTGKTTLSSDPTRMLIGDDEHGWSENGVFNFEGGCYAKAIKLSGEAEPDIYNACFRFGTVLENVVLKGRIPRARLRRRFTDREHAGILSARLHRQHERRWHRRASGEHRHADGGCLRGVAADQPAHARASDVSLSVWLHRQGRRHRTRPR